MGILVLGLAAAALFLLSGKDEKFTETPEQNKALFDTLESGFRAYKASLQALLVNGLIAKRVIPKDVLEGNSQAIAQAAGPVGIHESAYHAAAGLHDNGFDLWIIPAKLHLPTEVGQKFQLMFLPGGELPNKKLKTVAVRLIAASDPWPEPPDEALPQPPAAPPPLDDDAA